MTEFNSRVKIKGNLINHGEIDLNEDVNLEVEGKIINKGTIKSQDKMENNSTINSTGKEYPKEELTIPKEMEWQSIEPTYNIVMTNQITKKTLTLDFNTDKLIVKGNLKQHEAAKIFFESLDNFFQQAINKQVEKRLKEMKP